MEKTPTISQNFRNNGEWATLTLSDGEITKVRQLHRQYTAQVMRECLEDARNELKQADCTSIAASLFEARVDKFFTWVVRALQDKTRMARGNGGFVVKEERIFPSSS